MTKRTRELTCREMIELVTDYFENRLSPEARRRFEAHLALCDGCVTYVEQFRETVRALGTLPEDRLTPAALETLMSAFRTWNAGGA